MSFAICLEDIKVKKCSWTAELETGLSALDLDNKSLLGLVDQVIDASEAVDLAGLKSSLLDLQSEMITRFEREEDLMAAFKYEAGAQHQAEHQQLSAEIQAMIDDLDAGESGVAYIGRFMHNWLLQHIVSKDTLFGKAIVTRNGVTDRRQSAVDKQQPEDGVDVFEERRLENLKPIFWTSKLALGIEENDAGLRAIFAIFNAILEARKSTDKKRLAMLLEQLGNETAAHFQYEEKLMSRFGYEHSASHKEEHRKLLDEFSSQVDDWRAGYISADLLCRFMHRWLLRHVAISDTPLSEAIRRQNAEGGAS